MLNRVITLSYLLLTILLAWLLSNLTTIAPIVDSSFYIFEKHGWFNMLNLSLHSFHTWRFNTFFSYLSLDAQSHYLLSIFLFSFGQLLFLMIAYRNLNIFKAFSIALCSTAIILLFFGRDNVIFTSLSLMPWLSVSIIWVYRTFSFSSMIACLFVALLFSLSANQLSLLLVPIAIAIASSTLQSTEKHFRFELFLSFAIVLMVPAIISSSMAPLPSLPQYPEKDSHLVPVDGEEYKFTPLVTSYPRQVITDHSAVRERFGVSSAALFGLSGLLLIVLRLTHRRSVPISNLALILTSILCVDTLFPIELSRVGPLFTLTKLLPGLSFFTLVPIFTAASIVVISIILIELPYLTFLLAALISMPNSLTKLDPSISDFFKNTLSTNRHMEDLLLSPSYYTIKQFGPWILGNTLKLEELHEVKLSGLSSQYTVYGSRNQDMTVNLSDHKPESRWTAGGGSQSGDEWLLLKFSAPLTLAGLNLDPGPFFTDFPIGISVLSADSCDNPSSDFNNFQRIVAYPNWQGELRFTQQRFPYFGPKNSLKIYFPTEISTHCLLIKQTGKNSNWDWSVSELSLLMR